MTKGRRPRRGRGQRQRRGSPRSMLFIAFSLFALATLALLVLPPWGRASLFARGALYHSAGLLSFFLPLFSGAAAIRFVSPRSPRGAFTALLGGAVNLYFLSAMADMVGVRFGLFPRVAPFSPGAPLLTYGPGGVIAGRAGEVLSGLVGPVISYLVLSACFVASLVIFTGWDLAGDLFEIGRTASQAASRIREQRSERREVPAEQESSLETLRPPGPSMEEALDTGTPPFVGAGGNPWVRERRIECEPPLVPGFGRDEAQAPAAAQATVASPPASPGIEPVPAPPAAIEPRHAGAGSAPPEGEAPVAAVKAPRGAPTVHRYQLPDPEILHGPSPHRHAVRQQDLEETSRIIKSKLAEFGIECEVVQSSPGPVLTRFEVRPGSGVKVNSILSLSDDLALALKAQRIRILAPIPGKDAVGVEVPNRERQTVLLREILESVTDQKLPIALGKRAEGTPFLVDLCDMPHLLVAGTTGSGKTNFMFSFICTLLMKLSPWQVRLALIDPKKNEMTAFTSIPHLYSEVVTDARKAKFLLERLVAEMESRLLRLQKGGFRNIAEHNAAMSSEDERMPYIVLVVDELHDLFLVARKEVEEPIERLAQMARSTGIHLVVATQRPSVDVITGVIKANFPSRIAFMVQSKTDSRTILDMNGAEKLLGKGDMLFLGGGTVEPVRVHGSFVTSQEAQNIADFWTEQALQVKPEFVMPGGDDGNTPQEDELKCDELLPRAREVVRRQRSASVTLLQTRLGVGYPRAVRLIGMLEAEGSIGPFKGSKPREVLLDAGDAGEVRDD